MVLTSKEIKRIGKVLQAFANQYFIDGAIEIDYEKQVYYDLVSILYDIPEIKKLYDEDLAVGAVKREIEKRFDETPIVLEESVASDFLDAVLVHLQKNVRDHLIVIPIQYGQFDEVIAFHNITLIPEELSKNEKIEKLARLSGRTLDKTCWILEHTEKSRSPDFLKYPLLCFKQRQQTSSVHFNAMNVAKVIIYSLRCFYYSSIWNSDIDQSKKFRTMAELDGLPASHLLILAKDDWRLNHKPLGFDSSMDFDLTWLKKSRFQTKLTKFLNGIYLNSELDNFDLIFLNAVYLFNDSLKQDKSIETLLLMTIAESLLARDRNEKRLRISALIPHIIGTKKDKRKETSELFNQLYMKRNNFVHNAESVTILSNWKLNEPNELEVARKSIAQLILSYLKSDKFLINPQSSTGKETRLKLWNSLLDDKFNSQIFR